MMSMLKQAVRDSGKTAKSVAEHTGYSESSVSRYLSGEQAAPFDFVWKTAEYVGVSLDELTNNPTGAKHAAEKNAIEQLRATYEQRIEDKNAHIASQKERIQRMETAHAAELDRMQKSYERELAEKKLSRKVKDVLLILAIGGLLFYLVWDLTHPTEGMIQYQVYARQLAHWMNELFTV